MKKNKILQNVLQIFRPEEESQPLPADVFSEPRIPIRSKGHFNFGKLIEGFESLRNTEQIEPSTKPFKIIESFDPLDSVNSAVDNVSVINSDSSTGDVLQNSEGSGDDNSNNSTGYEIIDEPVINNSDDVTIGNGNDTIQAESVQSEDTTPVVQDDKFDTGKRPPRIYKHVSLNKMKNILKASAKFVGGIIDSADFDPKVKRINASSVKTDIELIGNDNDNSIRGGKGDDIIKGGEGNDSLTGGSGNDTFVYESGDDTITDYSAKKDTIKIEAGGLTDVSTKGSNVVFTFEEGGTLTVKNGKNKNITFVDEDDNEITEKFTMKNIDRAEELLDDLWFTPETENFANEGDQQFGAILEDDENYSSIGEFDDQPAASFTKSSKFKPALTYGRADKAAN